MSLSVATLPLKVGLLAGATSAMFQATTESQWAIPSAIIPSVSALIGAAVSYGILKASVRRIEEDMSEIRADMSHMHDLFRITSEIGRASCRERVSFVV
jgi:hypothetical protein